MALKIRKVEYNHTLLAAEDRVIASAPISMDGGEFISARGALKVISAADLNISDAVMIMLRGVVVSVYDWGDNTLDVDELWDIMVPKDEAHQQTAGSSQIDVGVEVGEEDTAAFSEPGRPSPTALAGENYWGTKVYGSEHILTFADTADGFKDATPDTFIPKLSLPFGTDRAVRAQDTPGYALFAIGTPLLTGTVSAAVNVINSEEWLILRHLRAYMEDAWKQFAGLDEAGAESPGVNIAVLLVELTEPDVMEETAGAWATSSFDCFSRTEIFYSTPGDRPNQGMLTSG